MYKLEELKENLIKVWTEIYGNEREQKSALLEILDEHEKMNENKLQKTEKHPFIGIAFDEIANSNKIKVTYRNLIESIFKSNDIIHWYPNPTFKDGETAIKNQNYCANLIGYPREFQNNPYLFYSEKIIGGLFLMGKNQFYPEHYHSAWESWVILSGSAKWKLEDGIWEIKKPGEHFTYTDNQVHAIKTDDEVLLALWAWTGELNSWAKWTKKYK